MRTYENRGYGYIDQNSDDRVYRQVEGHIPAGGSIGIIVLDGIRTPIMPGNVMSAYTFDFPVQYLFLEGIEMPPYVHIIQEATQRPVFVFITLLNWLNSGLCRKPFSGWM